MKPRVVLLVLLLGGGLVLAGNESLGKEILRIDVPLQVGEGYPFIRYRALDSGFAYCVREVGCAHQGCRTTQLSTRGLEGLTAALKALPASDPRTDTGAYATVTITERKVTRVLTYRCDQLPAALMRAIELLGGVPDELRQKIRFKLDQKDEAGR